jgi:hypothetical protein
VWNKITLHVFAALLSGFTFWMIGDGSFSLQLRLFAIFNFIFVAPGCINQMQPFFLHNRDLFETREKKVITFDLYMDLLSRAIANPASRKHITGSPSLLLKLSRRSLTLSFVRRFILAVGTLLAAFLLKPVFQDTSTFR